MMQTNWLFACLIITVHMITVPASKEHWIIFFTIFDKASETAKRNLEVRVYDCAQTLSMSIFDHHEQMKTGSMIVEFLIYGTTKIHLRPSLEFAQQHKAYETFHKSIAINLWNNSKPWPLYQISNQNK